LIELEFAIESPSIKSTMVDAIIKERNLASHQP